MGGFSMAIDKLQNAIRKLKNPSAVMFSLDKRHIPCKILEENTSISIAYGRYAKDLLDALKGVVPAVRFGFGTFALQGREGLNTLTELLTYAKELGFYVLLDAPEMLSANEASLAADAFLNEDSIWTYDGLVISSYIGSDAVKPFANKLGDTEKDLFLVLRTANRTAPELQDLLTGSRLVYMVAADMAKRLGEGNVGRCGYSRIAGVGPATSADSLRALRSKYTAMFLLVDGYDYTGANAKNCSLAFDKLGHGALVCAGVSVVGAWMDDDSDSSDPICAAVSAAERMKKNLTRYVTVL